jgi:hypothetical protein
MWSIEHERRTEATPSDVFALWADVERWPSWDASLVSTTLDGAFAAGATGTLHPRGAPEPIAFTITAVHPGNGFADETFLGPLALRFAHRVVSDGAGARICVRVEAEGPEEEQFGPMVAADLPESLDALAEAAERRRVDA